MKKTKTTNKNNKANKTHVSDTVKDIIDIYFYDDKLKCFIKKDKTYMDIIQINTKDLVSASNDDIEYDIMRYIKLYKMYADDIKIVAMNFPCRTNSRNISDTRYKTLQMKFTRNFYREVLMNLYGLRKTTW